MPTSVGRVPANQIESLPLVTVESVADPGDIVVVGGKMCKHWIPLRVGILDRIIGTIQFAPLGQGFISPGNLLDLTGVTSFTLSVSRRITSQFAGDSVTASVYLTPAVLGQSPIPIDATDWSNTLPRLGVSPVSILFNAVAPVVPYTQYGYRGVSNEPPTQGAPQWINSRAIVGGAWAVFMIINVTPNSEFVFWSLELWGMSD